MKAKTKRTLKASLGMPFVCAIISALILVLAVSPLIQPVLSVFSLLSVRTSEHQLSDIYEKDLQIPDGKTIPLSHVTMPENKQRYGVLTIANLEINIDLYFGDSLDVLKLGAGQYVGSSIPGYGKPILIGAHNTVGKFRRLLEIQPGEIVQIQTNYGFYEYEIYDTRLANFADTSAYDLSGEEEVLILYTCHPAAVGYTENRLFAYGKRISGPDILKGE